MIAALILAALALLAFLAISRAAVLAIDLYWYLRRQEPQPRRQRGG